MSQNVYSHSSDTHLIERVTRGEMAKKFHRKVNKLQNPHTANENSDQHYLESTIHSISA